MQLSMLKSTLNNQPLNYLLQTVRSTGLGNKSRALGHLLSPFHRLEPRSILGIILCQLIRLVQFLQQTFTDASPGNERQISISAFVTDQPARAVPCQTFLQDPNYSEDLIDISLGSRGKFLGMKASEPGCLSEIWTLAYL